jgi:hypothetical protein
MTERMCPRHQRLVKRCAACKDKRRSAPLTPDMPGFFGNRGFALASKITPNRAAARVPVEGPQ